MAFRDVMKRSDKPRSGVALGGIGAGSMELRKDGVFTNWTVFNNLPIFSGARPSFPDDSTLFFVVRYEEEGRQPRMKLLQIDDGDHPAGIGLQFYTFRWLSGVERIDYEASYPFARLRFSDRDMPFTLELEAFHPFIPLDVADSSLPGVFFRFHARSRSHRKVRVMLMATLRHMAGYDVKDRLYASRIHSAPDRLLVEMFADQMDAAHDTWGQMCIGSLDGDSTYDAGWSHRHTFYEPTLHLRRLRNQNTVDGQNALDKATNRRRATYDCLSTVARSAELTAASPALDHTFLVTWFFPNLYSDATKKQKLESADAPRRLEGHAYAGRFDSAVAVADHMIARREELTTRTRAFHRAFYDSSLPRFVLDQVNSHLNTFSTSCWLTRNGDFGIQEGLTRDQAWGPLATIDVGMYGSIATAALFPELDRSMYLVHQRLQYPSGDVQHGVGRNFGAGDAAHEGVKSRVDLAIQYAIQALRHYFFTADRAYLADLWPSCRAALDYTLTQRDRDGDGLPEMEGSNCSYDNFPMFGPASYIASQWIAALMYGAAAAREAGDAEAAARYDAARAKARATFEAKLWNGRYFVLYNDEGGAHGGRDEGCLSDQLIGQWATAQVGLGDVADRRKLVAALRHVVRRNFAEGEGLYNCRWPGDAWLHPVADSCWFDQANTHWTGVELELAALLVYEGLVEDGLAMVRAVDTRYREAGRYWDHQEWGGHYYRAMSAWSLVNSFLGLAVRGDDITFAPRWEGSPLRLFFATGAATGTYRRRRARDREVVELRVHDGRLAVGTLRLGVKLARVDGLEIRRGRQALANGRLEAGGKGVIVVRFDEPVVLGAGDRLTIACRGLVKRPGNR